MASPPRFQGFHSFKYSGNGIELNSNYEQHQF